MGNKTAVTNARHFAYTVTKGNAKGRVIYLKRCKKPIGIYLMAAGIFVLLAIILPPVCWWVILGVALIAAGIFLNQR